MKKVIVIGATSGIGLEIARLLRKQGCAVGVAGRRKYLLEAFCDEFGAQDVYSSVIDVTDNRAAESLRALIEEMGGVDTVVLCAGTGSRNPGLAADVEISTVETNVTGFVRMAGAAYAYFRGRGGGHLAVVSSIAGTRGLGIAASYSASKRFQNTYIQSLAQLSTMEHAGIRFTDIRPGFVDTALLKSRKYPMMMRPEYVARRAVKAIGRNRRMVVVDWRYAVLVVLWRLIPSWIWERMHVK